MRCHLLRTYLLPLCIGLLISEVAYASPVYRYEDKQGNVHYSTTPPQPDAKPAELPSIMRGEVKLPKVTLVTCDGHGGVNCELGPDADGSVVCSDGFREATNRFRFSCVTPKLEIADITEVEADGSFKVLLRNRKQIPSKATVVSYKNSEGAVAQLEGPAEVESLGSAEYLYRPLLKKGEAPSLPLKRPDAGDVTVSCANC